MGINGWESSDLDILKLSRITLYSLHFDDSFLYSQRAHFSLKTDLYHHKIVIMSITKSFAQE